ncbi:hypothetical protein JX265_001904 [Neoarthrinium moseri]|uniref:Tyrosinase copper-binding domain-containing protein n=1 Tax=Neoarthrinium moseri TaxID=1658444 RepID=A0A9P9WW19_9PEZI|nr:uncharacterized protein JN550_005655 [Neoarthrinium moseri]KAI1847898.1 hypothetical protein JX266_006011 [Neoarthrinium moseri]KAI1869674.1 hypothetical protein JN550_005655 [Neoarthrinium moseri]KAI1880283.1 hypothetical protein JX265_001904 [Neoarthrinium moseri]
MGILFGKFLLSAIIGLAGFQVSALPTPGDTPKCTTPTKRMSWHDMTDDAKKSYLAAEQCVMSSPATVKLPGAKTKWDQLVSLHQIHALQIHSTGTFLPYHRYFLHTHEFLLNECGYKGGLPYWDEPRDAGKFSSSPVFSPTLGFGGDGKGAKNCVADGPFSNVTVNIGPGFTTQPRCVNRKITNFLSSLSAKAQVTAALNYSTYDTVWNGIYSGPHLGGHMALSMMNGDSITSPGDPVFFLHHGFVDKMWWDWQAQNPSKRLTEIGGPNAQDPAIGFTEFPGGMEVESQMWGHPTAEMAAAAPDPHAGDKGNVTTLGHVLTSKGIIPDATIADIMDIKGGYLCYDYV